MRAVIVTGYWAISCFAGVMHSKGAQQWATAGGGEGATVGYSRGANSGPQSAMRPILTLLTYKVVRTSRPVLLNITCQPPVIQVWDVIP